MDCSLEADAVRRVLDPATLAFATTEDVAPLHGLAGQPRVAEALDLALGTAAPGANVFATGPAGAGKLELLEAELRRRAATEPAPPDWVYVFGFGAPRRPAAIALATGRGPELERDVRGLVEESRRAIRAGFEAEPYRRRHGELHERGDARRREVLATLQAEGRARDLAVELTPGGFVSAPLVDGRPVDPKTFETLTPERRERFQAANTELEQLATESLTELRAVDREEREQHHRLDRETALLAVEPLFAEACGRWAGNEPVQAWLEALREDLVEQVETLRGERAETSPLRGLAPGGDAQPALTRYAVNVLVTNEPGSGAPVVAMHDGNFFDLFGRIDYETSFGAAVTDHRHIRAGAVHRAAGGYLLVRAEELLVTPFAWSRLKELLRTGLARIENPGQQYMLFPSASLDPEPIRAALSVVLVGSSRTFGILRQADEELARLFKVRADFDDEMPWDERGVATYAAFAARRVAEEHIPHLGAAAVARVVEHGARLAGHRDRLTTRFPELGDIIGDAGRRAQAEGADLVTAAHVDEALLARRHLSDLPEQRLRELALDGTLRIALTGAAPGQVNGLAVAELPDRRFGHPVRVSATVGPGQGRMIDIDRETELSGPVHDKGFLILSGLLRERYCRDAPLALHASLVFEQSYGPIEGDSASSAELFALLSALAEAPIDQRLAVTGSVDQHGAVQAIGGVNEKIEGFFRLCRRRGLTGDQGVVIPAANLPNLMLDRDVADAVAAGTFRVCAISTVDEGIELLTGMPAGEPAIDGTYPEQSFGGRVQARLARFAAVVDTNAERSVQ